MRRPILLLALVFTALLGAMAAKSALIELPPVRADNAPDRFDAERAAGRLAFVLGDQRPHPADTPANDRVRDKIVMLLRSMGLTPIVRDQVACNELFKQRGVSCARVRNVIAMLGPPGGKAVLLNAHYDSTPVGPGAGDDGIGVATLLEVGSIISRQALKRPVILLFNEGEELGLVGARAFLADPLSRNVDSLVNLEARGVSGPANMFETSVPNGAAIALFSHSAARPVANSLSTDVYRQMPNYTDVNSFASRGWLTLNIAPIGNETRYHSAGDTVEALDRRTLQHMGDQTLALTQALASGAAPSATGERIFMDVAGRGLITLPLIAGVIVIVGLLIAFGLISWRRGRMLRGAAIAIGAMIGSAAVTWVALAIIGAVRHGMFWRAEPVWTHIATYASVILAAAALLGTVGAKMDRTQLRAAFWLVFLLIGGAIGLAAPGGIIFFLFPPLIILVGLLAKRRWPLAERIASWLAILFLYLTWGAMLALLEELLNGGPMWLFAPLGALLILPVLIEIAPLIRSVGARAVAILAGGLVLLGWGAAAAAPAYSPDRQQRFVIEHVTDLDTRKSWWSVVNDGKPLPPGFSHAGDWKRDKLPFSDRPRWLASAPPIDIVTPPSAQPLAAGAAGGKTRTIRVTLRPNGADSITLIGPKDADIRAAGVKGFVRPLDPSAKKQKYFISCFGRTCDGQTLEIVAASDKPIDFTLVAARRGLPPNAGLLVASRPKNARPQYLPDQTLTLSKIRL
ncbi:MAG TPA: M28 family peptidase [Sphingomicrobium sp.]|nr:M28 family peptidase [Sphingomicrobium sp.]